MTGTQKTGARCRHTWGIVLPLVIGLGHAGFAAPLLAGAPGADGAAVEQSVGTPAEQVAEAGSRAMAGDGLPDGVPFAGAHNAPASSRAVSVRSGSSGGSYHVDCRAAGAGDGSKGAPFTSFQSVNALTLGPGDEVLLARGTRCAGHLSLKGDGGPGDPVVVGSYGSGPLPVVTGPAEQKEGVTLTDMSHLVVQDLDITLPQSDPTGATYGLAVRATEGVLEDVVVQRVHVHDIGSTRSQAGGAGITVAARTARVDGLTLRENRVTDVQQSGIGVQTTSDSRQVLVTANEIRRVSGDGILVFGSQAPVLSWNTVHQAGMGNKDLLLSALPAGNVQSASQGCRIGLWTWATTNAVLEHNEVTHTQFESPESKHTGCDGEAFDLASSDEGTVIQYNYSRNNSSFILIDASDGHHGTVRFNLSVDDTSSFSVAQGPGGTPLTSHLQGIKVYNNTWVAPRIRVYTQHDDVLITYPSTGNFGGLVFQNNILYSYDGTPKTNYFYCGDPSDLTAGPGVTAGKEAYEAVGRPQLPVATGTCTHNLFYNMPSYGSAAVNADPRFEDAYARGGGMAVAEAFRVAADSPAVCEGVVVDDSDNPNPVLRSAVDFFGQPVPQRPTIGFHQQPCTAEAPAGG